MTAPTLTGPTRTPFAYDVAKLAATAMPGAPGLRVQQRGSDRWMMVAHGPDGLRDMAAALLLAADEAAQEQTAVTVEEIGTLSAETVIEWATAEEITEAQACDLIGRTFPSSSLLTESEAAARRSAGLHVSYECEVATWVERAVNLLEECLRPSHPFCDSNDESLGLDYDHHLKVLAGELGHRGAGDYACTDCAVVTVRLAVA